MAAATAAVVGGMAIAGGVAGSQKKKSETASGVHLTGQSVLDQYFEEQLPNHYEQLLQMAGSSGDNSDSLNYASSQRDLAALLGKYANGDAANPTGQDISRSNELANALFANRQVALGQSFEQQGTASDRLAAQLGRPVNDPILQAKLRTGFMQQQSLLDAEKGGFAAQMAQALPMQRLGFEQQRTDVLGNLARQAMSNRQALLGLGAQMRANEQQFRLGASERYGRQTSGGGFAGALNGAMAGAGAGMGMAGMMGGMGMMGGGMGGMGGGMTPMAGAPYSPPGGAVYG